MIVQLFCAFILAAAPVSEKGWRISSNSEFTFRYSPGLERVAEELFGQAGDIKAEIEYNMGFKYKKPIIVVIAPDRPVFIQLQGGGLPDWISGTAYPDRNLIFLRPLDAREIRGGSMRSILVHEMSHVLLFERLNAHRAPRWLDEGTAMHMAGDMTMSGYNTLLGVGITGRHIPFRSLTASFPSSREDAMLAYAQSSDMVSYIKSEYGPHIYVLLLDSLAKGNDIETALKQSIGMDMEGLESEWLGSVRRRWGLVPALTGGFSIWFFMALLFLVAYARKRKTARLRREMWEIEEGINQIDFDHEKNRSLH